MENEKLQALREDYKMASFDEKDAQQDPFVQFSKWITQALSAEVPEPNAFNLATIGPDGFPDVRTVLLKGLDDGFVFYTNYHSTKGRHIEQNPYVSANFLWLALERQVRIKGTVTPLTEAENDAYFYSRPFESQLGAIASPQSQRIKDRDALEKAFKDLQSLTPETIKRPSHWGGYRIIPHAMEFWQGRSSRLHDRIAYRLESSGNWQHYRLAP
jgi:pyridoxamine 5'-phosphate oxidase